MDAKSIYRSSDGEKAIIAAYESVLAHWPVPCDMLTVPTQHGDTFVIASGEKSAPPLVLLHGASSNSAAWGADVIAYSPHYRVYAVDLIGEPGKSAPNRPAWDGPAFAEWLGDALDALEVDRTSLLGISQGGWTALRFATHSPERVTKLVLLTPGGIIPERTSFLLSAIVYSLLGGWGTARLKRLVYGNLEMDPEVDAYFSLITKHFKPRIEALPMFSNEELRHLTMPVLLIGGAQDSIRDVQGIAARMEKLLPQFEAVIIPDAGHVLLNTPEHTLPFLAGAP